MAVGEWEEIGSIWKDLQESKSGVDPGKEVTICCIWYMYSYQPNVRLFVSTLKHVTYFTGDLDDLAWSLSNHHRDLIKSRAYMVILFSLLFSSWICFSVYIIVRCCHKRRVGSPLCRTKVNLLRIPWSFLVIPHLTFCQSLHLTDDILPCQEASNTEKNYAIQIEVSADLVTDEGLRCKCKNEMPACHPWDSDPHRNIKPLVGVLSRQALCYLCPDFTRSITGVLSWIVIGSVWFIKKVKDSKYIKLR